jgi:hypothetical protein
VIINYIYRISNLGSESVTPLRLFDDSVGVISINETPLKHGDVLLANATARALMPGYLNNTATLEYADHSGRIAAVSAFASVLVKSECIFFKKEASIDAAVPGDIIIYNFTISNKLDKQISGLTVIDNMLGPVAMNRSILGPGDQARGTKTYLVKDQDLPGPLVNLAEFTAYDSWNRKLTGRDMAKVLLSPCITESCCRECGGCQSIQIINYANISGNGQNIQLFSKGQATVSNTSQSISQDQNENNTESKIRSNEYH